MTLLRTPARAMIAAAFAAAIASCAQTDGAVAIPKSDHFDGTRFFNREPGNSLTDHIKWLWQMEVVDWPEWIDDPPQPPPPASVAPGALRVTYINQSTVLIQLDGLNILTDPIWSKKAGSLLGVPRVRAPGVQFEQLPKIDIVLISHDHYDHLDLPTLRRLIERDRPLVLTGLKVGVLVELPAGAQLVELDWWEQRLHSSGAKITFVPARHESGRGLFDADSTLWGGFVIERACARVLFFGDTAYGSFVDDIRRRFPRFDLALLPIGNYEPRWFMGRGHMHPEDAVRMHRTLEVRQSIAVHYATFREHPEQAIDAHEKDLKAALAAAGVPEAEFWILGFGEGREVPRFPCDSAAPR